MSERACSAFMDMTVVPVAPETILYGRLTDAQLHGLLALCQDLGLQVVAISSNDPEEFPEDDFEHMKAFADAAREKGVADAA